MLIVKSKLDTLRIRHPYAPRTAHDASAGAPLEHVLRTEDELHAGDISPAADPVGISRPRKRKQANITQVSSRELQDGKLSEAQVNQIQDIVSLAVEKAVQNARVRDDTHNVLHFSTQAQSAAHSTDELVASNDGRHTSITFNIHVN